MELLFFMLRQSTLWPDLCTVCFQQRQGLPSAITGHLTGLLCMQAKDSQCAMESLNPERVSALLARFAHPSLVSSALEGCFRLVEWAAGLCSSAASLC